MTLYDYCVAFDRTDLLEQWNRDKNKELSVSTVTHGSRKQAWRQCEKDHEWVASVSVRTSGGNGCPVCGGKKIIPGENDLATVFPELAKQWHTEKNDSLSPQAVFPYSNRKV